MLGTAMKVSDNDFVPYGGDRFSEPGEIEPAPVTAEHVSGLNNAQPGAGRALPRWLQLGIVAGLFCTLGAVLAVENARSNAPRDKAVTKAERHNEQLFVPTPAQLASFTVQPVEDKMFQP